MTVIDTYTIQIIRDGGHTWLSARMRAWNALQEAEENITDLLPDGYRAVIRRWDEGDQDDD